MHQSLEAAMMWLIGTAVTTGFIGAFFVLYRRRLDVLTGPWIMRE
jgi:hypothetical protein